jgi:predicted nucleotide-binding protein
MKDRKDRFEGPSGQLRLIDAFCRQEWVDADKDVAARLAHASTVRDVSANKALFMEGDPPAGKIFFVLNGKFDILVRGNRISSIERDMAVGEFPLLHPGLDHTVTARASCNSIIAEVRDMEFLEIAGSTPYLWKNVARAIALRLANRGKNYRVANAAPRVFVGSSTESLTHAQEIQLGLSNDNMSITVWTDGVFKPSRSAIDSLAEQLTKSDFGIFVVSPEDLAVSRGKRHWVPRDNVVFEIGLCMGRLGPRRTILVLPSSKQQKIPSDLLGLMYVEYDDRGNDEELSAAFGPVNTRIRKHIAELGPITSISPPE